MDSLRLVLWSASEKYCGQSPIRTLVSLRKSFAFLMYHRTPNIGSIISMYRDMPSNTKYSVDPYHVPMTCHRTPHTVSIPTMHSHPYHVMSSCIMQCNHAIAHLKICYIHNESHMYILNHAYLSMHHLDNHVNKYTISK